MGERFQVGPAWAAVLVAIIIPTLGGVWYFAASQARTETTVATLDKRAEKMEAKLDLIASRLQVSSTEIRPLPIAEATKPCQTEQVRFILPRPLP